MTGGPAAHGPGGAADPGGPPAAAPAPPPPGVGPDTRVPDLLHAHPGARAILDRHGLRGCGGTGGPAETLAFFARAHAVPLEELLREVRAEVLRPAEASRDAPAPRPEDAIHRRFFRAGVLVTLTAGAAWGAALLLRIAWGGGFGAVTIPEVNAHGHAQVMGWLGLFAMGFGYQAFPRFLGLDLPWPRAALASFPLMLAGIVLRVAGEAWVGGAAGLAAGVAGAALETAAAGVFAAVVWRVTGLAGARAGLFGRWVRLASAWFVLCAAGEGALFVLTATAPDAATLVSRVATWQPALRDAELHGFALLLVLGVAGRYLPAILGLPAPSPRAQGWIFRLASAAAAVEIAAWLGYRLLGVGALARVAWGGGLLVLAAALLAATGHGVFRRAPERHRGLPFVRAAFAWLLLSSLMLAFLPFYARALGTGFPHAWAGAARHAVTVGFFSMMIVGVAAKVVPTLEGADPARLPSLLPVFLLLNLGCLGRVVLQVLTDAHPWAFRAVGFSGLLEVTALALWGIPLLGLMGRGVARAPAGPVVAIGPDTVVYDLLESRPAALEVLVGHGLTPLRNPVLRATLARGVTLRRAAGIAGVPLERLIDELERIP